MPHDLRTKTLRNQTKAYDMEDQLKAEYSISLNGKRYPLLTKTMKGFTSKASKSGKTRFNKLFNAPQSVKQAYISAVNNALNMHDATAKASVGDDMSNQNVSSTGTQKQEKDITLHSKLSYDKAPDSVAVFNEDKKPIKEEEEEYLETSQAERQQANVIEKRGEQQQQQQQAILNIGEAVAQQPQEEERYVPGERMKIKKSQRRLDLDAKRYIDPITKKPLEGKALERQQRITEDKKTRNKTYRDGYIFQKEGSDGKGPLRYKQMFADGELRMNNPKRWSEAEKEAFKKHKHIAPKQGAPKKATVGRQRKMRGGMLDGASHEQGGIPIEAEGGEFVMNKESTKHFEPQLKKMNDAGNELRDAHPYLKSRKMSKINKLKRKMRKGGRIYANGGKVSEIEQPSEGGGLVGG